MRIAAMVARGTEDAELVFPVDVWRRAGFTVDLIAVSTKKITVLQSGLKINADKTLGAVNLSQYDAIFLPGGQGHLAFKKVSKLLTQLEKFAHDPKKWILAICAAPSVLGEIGLLKGVRATAYPGYGESFKDSYVNEGVVHDGKFLTGQGPALALPFALKAITLLADQQTADKVQNEILWKQAQALR